MISRRKIKDHCIFRLVYLFGHVIMQITFSSSGVGGVRGMERIHITDYLIGAN